MAPKTTSARKKTSTRKIDKIDRLVAIATQECAEAGIKLKFRTAETDKDQSQGSFSSYNKELLIYMGAADWVQILAHELSHLRQAREGFFKSEDEYETLDGWYAGKKKLDMAELIHCTRYAQLCELDCEKRALKLLKELKLLTKREEKIYIQKANAYVFLWEIARRQGCWTNPDTPVLSDKKIYGLMPTTWIDDVSSVPDDFEAVVVDNCYS